MPSEQWGVDPFWLVIQEGAHPNYPLAKWGKCLLVERGGGAATIRSTTTDEDYKLRKLLRTDCSWFLDNSMPDVSVQQAPVMLNHLRDLLRS